MAANDQKSCFLLKYMAGQLQEVSSVIAHVPTHPAVLSPRYGTEKHLCFRHMPAQKHTQREKTSLGITSRKSTENLVL